MRSVREEQPRDEHGQGDRLVRRDRDDGAQLPLYARVALAVYGLLFLLAALAVPVGWISEYVWATLFVGCVCWEGVGVFGERRWRQEPLTRLYRDRLMRRGALGVPGYLFRVGFLLLFAWWMVHWIVPGW